MGLLLHQPIQSSLPFTFHCLLTNTFISHSLILICRLSYCLQPLLLACIRPSTAPSVKSSDKEAAAVTRLALTCSGSQGSHKGTEREVADKVVHICPEQRSMQGKKPNQNKTEQHTYLYSLHPWSYSKTIWMWSWETSFVWPCLSRGIGTDGLQRSPSNINHSVSLWSLSFEHSTLESTWKTPECCQDRLQWPWRFVGSLVSLQSSLQHTCRLLGKVLQWGKAPETQAGQG